jgi:hypothetical protein
MGEPMDETGTNVAEAPPQAHNKQGLI